MDIKMRTYFNLPFLALFSLFVVSTLNTEASVLYPDLPADCMCQPIHDWSKAMIPDNKIFSVFFLDDFQKAPLDTEGIDCWIDNAVLEKKHLETLQRLPKLKWLRISGTGLSLAPDATIPLQKIKSLEHLSLSETTEKNSDSLLEPISHLANLRSIELGPVSDQSLVSLKNCTQLEGLMLWNVDNLTDKGLENLPKMPKLKFLTIEGGKITGNGLKFITQCIELKTLELGRNPKLGDELAPFLRGLKSLCRLDLMDTRVGDTTAREIAQLPTLLSLGLGRTKVSDAGAKCLLALKQLIELQLFGTNISDAAVVDISKCQQLERLDLDDTRLTQNCWSSLETLTRLKFLRVPKTIFTEQSIPHIAKLRRLIDFEGKNFGDKEIDYKLEGRLESALPGLSINKSGWRVHWRRAHFERRDKRLREAGALQENEPAR